MQIKQRGGLGWFGMVVLLIACAGTKTKWDEGTYPSGERKYRIEVDELGVKNGEEIWWYENGEQKFRCLNKQGHRNGAYQAWYPSGRLWYQGKEEQGQTQDSLVYFHPNGNVKTVAFFRDGIQLSRIDYDSIVPILPIKSDPAISALDIAAFERKRLRQEGIVQWSQRVRATVETYWSLPKEMTKSEFRSVAKIKVARNGKILEISWLEKSPSASFNSLASKALKKTLKFPEFPTSIPDSDLEIQYEFVTPGRAPAAKKLMRH